LDKKLFFEKVIEMAKKITLKVVKKWDGWILEIFQYYLNKFDNLENKLNDKIESNLNNKVNNKNNLQFQNLIKKLKKED